MRILFLLFFVSSCLPSMDTSKLVFEAPLRDLKPAGENRPFLKLKTEVLSVKCIGCHKAFSSEEGLMTFISPGNPEGSRLFLSVESGAMPMGDDALSTAELELFRDYITSLKPSQPEPEPTKPVPEETKPDQPEPDETQVVTFSVLKEKILQPHCLQCHRKMDQEENLLKWVNTSDVGQSKLYLKTNDGSMPKGGTPLSEQEMAIITSYLSQFAGGK